MRSLQNVEGARTEAYKYALHVDDCPEDVEGAPESPGVAVEIVEVSLICEKLQMKNLDAAT